VLDGFAGEEAQERRCDRRRFRSIGGPAKPAGLDQRVVVVVRERDERWMSLHLIRSVLPRYRS
jgi:hypothetical protein